MVSSRMLADDDMTTGLVVHTDVDDNEGINYHRPRWLVARNRAELAKQHVDVDNGGGDGHDRIRGRQHEHGDGHSEEPLSRSSLDSLGAIPS